MAWPSILRWLRFNAVGAGGILVQASTLALIVQILDLHYLIATALAVEAAIIHNFFWHRNWTWGDRKNSKTSNPTLDTLFLLLRFNLTTGFVSIGGNLLFMRLLVGGVRLNPIIANLIAICICSLLNYLVNDRVVFSVPDEQEKNLTDIP